jgi:hypothetical protein
MQLSTIHCRNAPHQMMILSLSQLTSQQIVQATLLF